MKRPIRTIMVPLDLNVDTDPIVSWAIEWAQMKRARLVFLHVLPPAHVYASPFVDVGSYEDLYGLARKHAEDQLLEYASQARECGIEASVHVRVGNAPEVILAMTRDLGADLLIVGTHGRKGLAHVFLGSTAEKVVRLAPCPVFVAKESHPAAQTAAEVAELASA